MPAHPGRSAFAEPGTSSEGWSPATLPVWRSGDENRAPDTLVEATPSAIADAGSIPAVSTPTVRRFSFQIGDWGVFLVVDPLAGVRGRGFDAANGRLRRRRGGGTTTPPTGPRPGWPVCCC